MRTFQPKRRLLQIRRLVNIVESNLPEPYIVRVLPREVGSTQIFNLRL